MRVSIEVGHPGHVHYWKNVYWGLRERSHDVRIHARDKEICLPMLEALDLPYTPVGRNRPGLLRKAVGVLAGDWLLWRAARSFRPDVMVSGTSVYSAHVSRLLRCPHIGLLDTPHAHLILRATLPFTDIVYTPDSYPAPLPQHKHRTFRGFKELMYLRPSYFTPDPALLEAAGVAPDEPYTLVRLSSWDASHDIGDRGLGLGLDGLREYVGELERFGRVFLTSEIPLPDDLGRYALPVRPEQIHHLLAYASLYLGEGAVMASEAGVLGVPWIYVSSRSQCTLRQQQEQFALGWQTTDAATALDRARSILNRPKQDVRQEWKAKRAALLAQTDDVTAIMIAAIEEIASAATDGIRAGRGVS